MEGLYLISNKHMITNIELNNLIKYYNSFATTKQKKEINTILNKPEHTITDIKILKQYLFKYKCYIEANSINVDSRMNKLIRSSIYAKYNNKHI